jgi:hypothetical protein
MTFLLLPALLLLTAVLAIRSAASFSSNVPVA